MSTNLIVYFKKMAIPTMKIVFYRNASGFVLAMTSAIINR